MSRRSRTPRTRRARYAGTPMRLRPLRLSAALLKTGAVLAVVLALSGCAIYPTDAGSQAAETTWQVLDVIDTAQTAQLVRHPKCFYEADPMARAIYGNRNPSATKVVAVNLLLMPLHARVSRWFDDHADQAYADDADSTELWALGRFAWHALSLTWTAGSVARNYMNLGVTPFSARCPL